MSKREKINSIKYWLQRYGKRNDDTFYYDSGNTLVNNRPLYISLQYEFDAAGGEYNAAFLYKRNTKLNAEYIDDADDADLDIVLEYLYARQLK